jgi:AcrR family transcriptional regulator
LNASSDQESNERRYHHGDLKRAVIEAALTEIAEVGPSSLSLRSVARRAGVSHAAPAHHFGDKAGLLTAVAAEGYSLLAETTAAAWEARNAVPDVGQAYVRFAVAHRAHFEVMFRPELYRSEDAAVTAARDRAAGTLFASVTAGLDTSDPEAVWGGVVAVWSLVHGFSALWLNHNFYAEVGTDPERAMASAVAALGRLVDAGALTPPA